MRYPRAPVNAGSFAGGCWFCAGSTLLFRRAPVLQAVGLQDESAPRLEDSDWTLRFGLANGELVVQPVVAVAVELSSPPPTSKVYASCDILTDKWRKAFDSGNLPKSHFKRLMAYLDLERGVAALKAGRPTSGWCLLARSWLRRPRMSWHPSPGWRFVRHPEGSIAVQSCLSALAVMEGAVTAIERSF